MRHFDQKAAIADVTGMYDGAEMVMEECAELIQACSKFLRINGEGTPTSASVNEVYNNLAEEIADVRITIDEFMLSRPGILETDVNNWEDKKIKRRLKGLADNEDQELFKKYWQDLIVNMNESSKADKSVSAFLKKPRYVIHFTNGAVTEVSRDHFSLTIYEDVVCLNHKLDKGRYEQFQTYELEEIASIAMED